MQTAVRRHVPALTVLLSVVSLALVFGAVGRLIPVGALPRASESTLAVVPHVNAAISAVALLTVGQGWRWIRRGEVRKHRLAMIAGFVLFVAFLALYLYKVLLEGPAEFGGPDAVYRFVYLPVLAVHVLLAVVCVPLLYYVLLLAATRPVSEIPLTRHARVGRATAALWMLSFALGIAVYALLYLAY